MPVGGKSVNAGGKKQLGEAQLIRRFVDARWAGGSFGVTLLTILLCLGLGIDGVLETAATEWMRVAAIAFIHVLLFGLAVVWGADKVLQAKDPKLGSTEFVFSVVLSADGNRLPSVGVAQAVMVARIALVLVGVAGVVWVDGGGSVRPVALTVALWLGAVTDGLLLSRVVARADCSFLGAIRLSVLSLGCEPGDDRYRVVVGAAGGER